MPRLQNTILGKGTPKFDESTTAPQVDISELQSGQNGFLTDFSGYVSNAAYVRKNIIAVLIEAPRGFNDLPNGPHWVRTLKNLIELHPQSIEGLNSTLEVENVETAVGGAGEMQEDPSNVTRARSTPTFTWTDKYGKPIFYFMSGWITNLIMDPNTKVPRIVGNSANAVTDVLPDYNSMTVLFIEPDVTHQRVIHAWLCTNMRPKSSGEAVGRRDLTAAGESATYSIEFTALTQEGLGVRLMAQDYLNSLNLTAINPNLREAFTRSTGLSRDVAFRNGLATNDVTDTDNGYFNERGFAGSSQVDTPPPNE